VSDRVQGSHPRLARWQARVLVAALFSTVALGSAGCSDDAQSAPSAASVKARVAPQASAPERARSAPARRSVKAANMRRSKPVRLRIATIGVDSSLMALGLRSDRTMQVPPGAFPAGWYTGGPTPGELGPAVIAGHVDSRGPGVFYRLHQMRAGDLITVTRADGRKPVFRVQRVRQFPKHQFPTRLVYGNVAHPALRLITCGGSFNSQSGHYDDNIVVFADLVEPQG
jgi:Sortase domain